MIKRHCTRHLTNNGFHFRPYKDKCWKVRTSINMTNRYLFTINYVQSIMPWKVSDECDSKINKQPKLVRVNCQPKKLVASTLQEAKFSYPVMTEKFFIEFWQFLGHGFLMYTLGCIYLYPDVLHCFAGNKHKYAQNLNNLFVNSCKKRVKFFSILGR